MEKQDFTPILLEISFTLDGKFYFLTEKFGPEKIGDTPAVLFIAVQETINKYVRYNKLQGDISNISYTRVG